MLSKSIKFCCSIIGALGVRQKSNSFIFSSSRRSAEVPEEQHNATRVQLRQSKICPLFDNLKPKLDFERLT